MSVELPSQFTHDVKIEETAQGIRIHVHAYANDRYAAVVEAFDLYRLCKAQANNSKILMAPMEIKEVKNTEKKRLPPAGGTLARKFIGGADQGADE